MHIAQTQLHDDQLDWQIKGQTGSFMKLRGNKSQEFYIKVMLITVHTQGSNSFYIIFKYNMFSISILKYAIAHIGDLVSDHLM